MNKRIFICILYSVSAAFCSLIFAGDIQPSTTLTAYYSAIDGTSTNANDDLRKTLCTVISDGYVSIGYSSLQNQMFAASSNPTDFVNGTNKTMEDIYSSKPYKSSDNGSSASNCGSGWNKEHTVPQSWFGESSPMKSDAFHVYPTDIRMNSLRSSYPYGENDADKGCANWGYGSVGTSTFPGYSGTVFDPGEGGEHGSYKGDLARTYFYMATRYRTTNFTSGSGGTSFTYSGGVANLTPYMRELMLKWHREDPVSEKELLRNNAVYAHQKNRNPFIDYPELVEYIWGTKAGQTVVLATLVSAYDGETPPPGPQPQTPKFGVTWSVNGEEILVDSIQENQPVATLPAAPASCSATSTVFVGWTDAAIDGIAEAAPAVLYTAPADFPIVTADVTYYAVFAQEVESETSMPAVLIFDADHQEGWTNTASKKNSYWLLDEGKQIVSPAIDLMGLESIVVKMRTYGGAQFNMLDIWEESGKLTSIEAAAGSTMTEYTWNNNLYIAGISTLTFSTTYESNKGIGIQSITINATGAGVAYTRYLTSCGGTEDIENQQFEIINHKLIIDGQLFIMVNDNLYNLQGQRVK